ncbi:X-linked retinitis pigmentosa GTPase regulator-interacting protein 1-like [Megalopta genalis]|uniref:X-linked retinitis pigmentosa GTPase regulator-interacting protein 1-like n=1 Tax=Megalopta genalis TaxID=115081 RepID=UPI003FD1B421
MFKHEIIEQNQKENDQKTNGNGIHESESIEDNTIIIEIVNVILFPKCSVSENPEIQLLYVEYCFLGYHGADMETISVKKPTPPEQKLTYNFRRTFRVDPKKHRSQDNILREMVNEIADTKIKFILVCEPVPEEIESKECIEVGYAYFDIRKYALEKSETISSVPIYTPDESEQIGLIKILVLGLDTIRQRLERANSEE